LGSDKQNVPDVFEQEITIEDELEPDEYRSSFLLRAADAVAFAVYSGPIDGEVIEAAYPLLSRVQQLNPW